MAPKKIAHSKRQTKDKPVDAEIRRAAERAGIKPTAEQPEWVADVSVLKEDLERFDALLQEAQRAAIEAAPREAPWKGGGTIAAIRAYDRIRFVRDDIAQLLKKPAGGAS